MVSSNIEALRSRVVAHTERVAELGRWPSHISRSALTERVPTDDRAAAGFDAGIACALDLIPRQQQKLSAIFHAAYTPAAVDQARKELVKLDADSDTAWWLAGCSVCVENDVNVATFLGQVRSFEHLAENDTDRLWAAQLCFEEMEKSFTVVDGIPLATKDGGMQGAYLSGFELATAYDQKNDIYFVGTFRPTLGLDGFEWANVPGPDSKSGPVHGSKQFVKAATKEELVAVISIASKTLAS